MSPVTHECCRFALTRLRPRRSPQLRPAPWPTVLSGKLRWRAASAKWAGRLKATNLRVTI